MILRDLIRDLFSAALSDLAAQPVQARVENARDERFGDFACTSAMDNRLREICGIKNPREMATKIIERLQALSVGDIAKKAGVRAATIDDIFSKVEIAGPGFINVMLQNDFLYAFTVTANAEAASYGRSQVEEPRNIVFEFVSANPTGPLNVVSARSAALGDSCCNLLEAVGEKVSREYYVNDYGNQVTLLGISCLFRTLEQEGIPMKFAVKSESGAVHPDGPGLPFPAEAYHGEYLKEIVDTIKGGIVIPVKEMDRLRELAHGNLKESDLSTKVFNDDLEGIAALFGKAAVDQFLSMQQADLESFRVRFDQFFRESSLHENGSVLKAAEDLKAYVYDDGGKKVFRSTDFGDDKDRVIVREDGRPTYLLADIAYHHTKIQRGFSHIFDIWGPDHHGYIARLAGAVKALGYPEDRFRVLIAQQVNLLENGQPVVMSKRTGKIITLRELIDEIPLDVVRYFFIMRSFEAHLDFDLAEARDTSEKNPYYYVAYAHARIRSIVQKAVERGVYAGSIPEKAPGDLEWSEERRRLLLLIARFPEEVREAALSFEPHRLIVFLYQTASALSRFYGLRENKIIDLDASTASTLLAVLQGVAVCLKRGLGLLGMEAPDRMDRAAEADTE
ncbi:MAG: arginine--tRNA ligase [Spirochaetae bacterium HGW-Spirochaetae-10]|jgi:arginyl-tRNA synthetase|nr:MAG: arginine--tRNA ligase [Spirochaetae bacterium HGW-Spirochaetae-10]